MASCSRQEFTALSQHILTAGNRLRFRACGRSMAPFIENGDMLEAEPCDGERLKRGDIAFYLDGTGAAVVHRVLSRRRRDGQDCVLVRGDATRGRAEEIPTDRVLGRIACISRGNRYTQLGRRPARLAGMVLAVISSLEGRIGFVLRGRYVVVEMLVRFARL